VGGGGEMAYLILTTFASQSWEEGGGGALFRGWRGISKMVTSFVCINFNQSGAVLINNAPHSTEERC
jgi:hypothetical protein